MYGDFKVKRSSVALTRLGSSVALIFALSLGAAAAQPGYRPQPRNVMRLMPSVIVDATGFDRPIAAATIFTPYGWRAQGGVLWANDFACTNGYAFNWSATSPDGSSSIWILPQTAWEWNNTGLGAARPGCMILQITNVRDYLQATVSKLIPGARFLDYRDRPDLVAEVGIQPSRTPAAMGESRTWGEGGEILFAFTDKGRDMRGTLSAVITFGSTISDTGAMFRNDPTAIGSPFANQPPMQSNFGRAMPAFAAIAPNGQFNFAYFEALRKSIKVNPDWINRITNHDLRIGQIAVEESRKRSEIVMQSNAEIARIRNEAWRSQQESADKRVQQFIDVIRGVTTYKDSNAPGGTVGVQGDGNYAWRLSDGSYVTSDNPNFDPSRDMQMSGERLEVAR